MQLRQLTSGQKVSAISLGAWQTYERMPFEDSVAVLSEALARGVTFFDVARYGTVAPQERGEGQPIPPGSPLTEVIFGRAMSETGASRDSFVLSSKLWFDTYPAQSFSEQLDGIVLRTGLEYVDIVCVQVPPDGLGVGRLVGEVGRLSREGRVQGWGVINWSPTQIREAWRVAREIGVPGPTLVELKYSAARRLPAELPAYESVCQEFGLRVHASNVLEGGLLSGKHESLDTIADRRILPDDAQRVRERFVGLRGDFQRVAESLGVAPAVLSVAFVLANPLVGSALIGATKVEQVAQNVEAIDLLARVGASELRALLERFDGTAGGSE